MIFFFQIWLNFSMSIIFWSRVYLIFQKQRADPEERKIDLIINSIFAILFTFASIDLFMTIPEIIELLEKIRMLV